MFTKHHYFKNALSSLIANSAQECFSQLIEPDILYTQLVSPPEKDYGDIALGLFSFSKLLKKAPPLLALELEKSINSKPLPDFIQKVKAIGPYLNFHYNYQFVSTSLIDQILTHKFFQIPLTIKPEKTMIEFSQPNTHKEIHVGHMRNLCLGASLVNIYRYCGYEVISSTFPGDVGTHVAKCLWYYHFHNQSTPPENRKGAWLGTLYSKGHLKLDDERNTPKEESNRIELTKILKEIEAKNGPFYDLWKETRQWSIELMQDVYKWAEVTFDHWYWESQVDSASLELVKKYYDKGLFIDSQGAIGIDLSTEKLGFCLLIKSDGNGLYATKDLELARRKFQDHKIEKNIYVVDKRQELHFKQVFRILELMGFEEAKKCFHLKYDFVELPDGAMSSRKGNIVAIQALIDEMVLMIKEQYLKKYQNDWSQTEIDEVANIVAKGAIKFGMCRIDPQKKIVFDMKEWLKLDGESGPYIQYVGARIQSILKKYQHNENISEIKLTHPLENNILSHLLNFNEIVENCCIHNRPSALCNYLYDLAKAFNSFYAECPVLGKELQIQYTRIQLCRSVLITLTQGLALLGIKIPEKM